VEDLEVNGWYLEEEILEEDDEGNQHVSNNLIVDFEEDELVPEENISLEQASYRLEYMYDKLSLLIPQWEDAGHIDDAQQFFELDEIGKIIIDIKSTKVSAWVFDDLRSALRGVRLFHINLEEIWNNDQDGVWEGLLIAEANVNPNV